MTRDGGDAAFRAKAEEEIVYHKRNYWINCGYTELKDSTTMP